MRYTYRFANGEMTEIEVTENEAFMLTEMDRLEYNNDHKETRRHVHFDPALEDSGDWLATEDATLEAITEDDTDEIRLRRYMETLLPEQRALIDKVYLHGRSYAEIAHEEGVDRSAVRKRMERILGKLKKSFE